MFKKIVAALESTAFRHELSSLLKKIPDFKKKITQSFLGDEAPSFPDEAERDDSASPSSFFPFYSQRVLGRFTDVTFDSLMRLSFAYAKSERASLKASSKDALGRKRSLTPNEASEAPSQRKRRNSIGSAFMREVDMTSVEPATLAIRLLKSRLSFRLARVFLKIIMMLLKQDKQRHRIILMLRSPRLSAIIVPALSKNSMALNALRIALPDLFSSPPYSNLALDRTSSPSDGFQNLLADSLSSGFLESLYARALSFLNDKTFAGTLEEQVEAILHSANDSDELESALPSRSRESEKSSALILEEASHVSAYPWISRIAKSYVPVFAQRAHKVLSAESKIAARIIFFEAGFWYCAQGLKIVEEMMLEEERNTKISSPDDKASNSDEIADPPGFSRVNDNAPSSDSRGAILAYHAFMASGDQTIKILTDLANVRTISDLSKPPASNAPLESKSQQPTLVSELSKVTTLQYLTAAFSGLVEFALASDDQTSPATPPVPSAELWRRWSENLGQDLFTDGAGYLSLIVLGIISTDYKKNAEMMFSVESANVLDNAATPAELKKVGASEKTSDALLRFKRKVDQHKRHSGDKPSIIAPNDSASNTPLRLLEEIAASLAAVWSPYVSVDEVVSRIDSQAKSIFSFFSVKQMSKSAFSFLFGTEDQTKGLLAKLRTLEEGDVDDSSELNDSLFAVSLEDAGAGNSKVDLPFSELPHDEERLPVSSQPAIIPDNSRRLKLF